MDRTELRKIVKKRIMFSKENDYYFLIYNALLFLYINGFISEEKRLIDFRKLAYIIPIISNPKVLEMLETSLAKGHANVNVNVLQNIYYNTRLNIKIFTATMLALEHEGYVKMLKNPSKSCIDVWLNVDKIPKLLTNKLFSVESDSIKRFNKAFMRIRIINLSTLLEKIFTENGVIIWEA